MKLREKISGIVYCIPYIILGLLIIGGIVAAIHIIGVLKNGELKIDKPNQYIESTTKQTRGNKCSIFANQCIVDEWEPACLLVKCMIDGRTKQ